MAGVRPRAPLRLTPWEPGSDPPGEQPRICHTADLAGQDVYVKASNTDAGDEFGQAVALSGNTLVVGTYDEDSSASGVNGNEVDNSAATAGVVYVLR